jgi:hypothetical protein
MGKGVLQHQLLLAHPFRPRLDSNLQIKNILQISLYLQYLQISTLTMQLEALGYLTILHYMMFFIRHLVHQEFLWAAKLPVEEDGQHIK